MGTEKATTPDDQIWNIYKSLMEQCQHFNSLESTYRALASTWLLAAFAAIGFVLKDIQHGNWVLYIAAIAGAAAVGIFLLWLMDLMVYHRLLGAAFAEQIALEREHEWLPKVAHGMMSAHGGAGVIPKIVWFYIAPYILLVGIASVATIRGATPTWSIPIQVLCIAVCFASLGVGVALYMYFSATARTTELAVFERGSDEETV